jgi:hypothetical protein
VGFAKGRSDIQNLRSSEGLSRIKWPSVNLLFVHHEIENRYAGCRKVRLFAQAYFLTITKNKILNGFRQSNVVP